MKINLFIEEQTNAEEKYHGFVGDPVVMVDCPYKRRSHFPAYEAHGCIICDCCGRKIRPESEKQKTTLCHGCRNNIDNHCTVEALTDGEYPNVNVCTSWKGRD